MTQLRRNPARDRDRARTTAYQCGTRPPCFIAPAPGDRMPVSWRNASPGRPTTGRPDQAHRGGRRFSSLLVAQAVEIHDHNDEQAGDDALPERIEIEQVGAVVDRGQDERA